MASDKKRSAAEAGALQTALALAARVNWHFGRGPLPTTTFAQFLYVEAAQLLLVPTSAGLPFAMRQVEPVVRETRSDALIVSRPDGEVPAFAMATWALSETVWTRPLDLWLAETGTAWLVPPGGIPNRLGFELGDGLHPLARVPWALDDEREAGIARAVRWLEEEAPGVTR